MIDLLLIGVGILLFILLFHPILRTVRQIPLFRGGNAVMMTICVTVLGIIGLYEMFFNIPPYRNSSGDQQAIWLILIPYAVLVLVVLITLLIRFRHRWFSLQRNFRNRKNTEAEGNDNLTPTSSSKKLRIFKAYTK